MSENAGQHGEGASADPRVAAALDRLDSLTDLPPSEHVDVYEQAHGTLQEVLADASERADASNAAPDTDPDAGSSDT